MKFHHVIALTIAASLTGGCATTHVNQAYEGPVRPKEEVATLSVPYQVDILSINGRAAPGIPLFSAVERHDIELLPGFVELVARYNSPYDTDSRKSVSQPVLLRFVASAGLTYELMFNFGRSAREASLWISHQGNALPDPGPASTTSAQVPGLSPVAATSGLDALKQQWEKATPAEQDAFKAWLKRN